MRSLSMAIAAVSLVPILVFAQASVAKPPPPAADVPELNTVRPSVFCGNCDRPFDTSTHEKILESLASNPYNGELRRALYTQDTLHQFESKAHFDNCDFDGAIAYMEQLLDEVGANVASASRAKAAGDKTAAESAIKAAFFSLGQALHGAQDFYAHSNYVELSVKAARTSADLAYLAPWTDAGKASIRSLAGKGLVSGFVFWGFPQKCPSGTASHGDLAKDKATTKSGAVKVAHLENRSQYQIAVQLARAASQALMDNAFNRWPLMKEYNGPNTAFELLVDRRGL
ncbi:MAG: hypothetical protein EKK45_06895 [Curvibacter sp.]|nr:MAG: hypothetical protein EKK45_06895 [Curvibacter sp.]